MLPASLDWRTDKNSRPLCSLTVLRSYVFVTETAFNLSAIAKFLVHLLGGKGVKWERER